MSLLGLPHSSVDKESTCNAGDPDSIPGSGRSAGEGLGYPLQYSWASLVVQLVKNLPSMRETWVRSLGWEAPLEKGRATHSNILAWRIPWTVYSTASQRVQPYWAEFYFHFNIPESFTLKDLKKPIVLFYCPAFIPLSSKSFFPMGMTMSSIFSVAFKIDFPVALYL